MQTYLSCENIPAQPRSVALGLFDGLHPAHRQVILAATMGIEDGTAVSVYTFDPADQKKSACQERSWGSG